MRPSLSGVRGSSPLTRGTRIKHLEEAIDDRFIPAYAGNSKVTVAAADSISVHPRLRGELWTKPWEW